MPVVVDYFYLLHRGVSYIPRSCILMIFRSILKILVYLQSLRMNMRTVILTATLVPRGLTYDLIELTIEMPLKLGSVLRIYMW